MFKKVKGGRKKWTEIRKIQFSVKMFDLIFVRNSSPYSNYSFCASRGVPFLSIFLDNS